MKESTYIEKSNEAIIDEISLLLDERNKHFESIAIIDKKIKKIQTFCVHSKTYTDESTSDISCCTCGVTLKTGNRT